MYSPLEYAYLLYMAAHGGKAGGKQPIYWGAQAGTGTGGVGGVSGGSRATAVLTESLGLCGVAAS